MEKIIEDQTPLPYTSSRQFSTAVNDQKIIEVKLFSDAEDGTYDKLASGFVTISENLTAGSKLHFTFNLDEDEMQRFMTSQTFNCPYFNFYDEYGIVRKQN